MSRIASACLMAGLMSAATAATGLSRTCDSKPSATTNATAATPATHVLAGYN